MGFPGSSDGKKNPPAMPETWVQSMGWEDPLEEGMATHSSILAWEIPWTEEPGKLPSTRSQRVGLLNKTLFSVSFYKQNSLDLTQ